MYFSQAALFERFNGQAQMTVMNRIERSAKNADRAMGRQLQCQSAHVRQHMSEVGGKARGGRTVNHAMVVRQR